MGGKDCQCVQEANKVTNPTRFNAAQFLRVAILASLTLTTINFICYLCKPDLYVETGGIFTATNILVLVLMVTACRTLFVGTCCLPDLQLSKAEVQKLVEQRDVVAQQRIMGNQMNYAKTLSAALQIPTISYDPHDKELGEIDYTQLTKLIDLIQNRYPNVHQKLTRTIINEHSLVFHWKSTNPLAKDLKPYCLTAHMDVVPAPEPEKWTHPPFSGHIDDSFIWGRGAIDDKDNVFAILEAVEDILINNPEFVPVRDIYLAFGQDEEIGGFQGAAKIAEHFYKTLGPQCFEFVADEGLFIVDGMVPGHKKPVAFVCVAEKGAVSVELSIEVAPGHASAPPKESAIDIISKAVHTIHSNPFESHFDGPAETMFEQLRSGFSGAMKFVFCNLWLFGPLVKKILASNPMTATMVRTTSALTIFKAGQKVNLLPSSASAIINHRIHPLDSVQKVLDWDRALIKDERIKIRAIEPLEPAPVSSSTHAAFKHITHAIYQTFDDICSVVPGVFVANSDSKHYWNLTQQIYRFNPILLRKDEVNMFHGFNEKIGIEAYAQLIFFWRNIIMLNNDPKTTPRSEPEAVKIKSD